MNCLLFRRLTTELNAFYLRFNSINKSLNSLNTLRQLNTISGEKHCKQNVLKANQSLSQPFGRSISTSHEMHFLTKQLNEIFLVQKRYKKGKKGGKRDVKEESSDEESEAEEVDEYDADLIDGKAIGFEDKVHSLISLRLDNVLKFGLNMARSKVDESFYNNLIRVNGHRVSKKSAEMAEDDEIDFIKGFNQENPELLDVSRVVVKKIEDKASSKDRIPVKLRRFRNLSIENYANDPYDGFAINVGRDKREEEENKKK